MTGGYVKLFRSIDQWEWYKDTNTKSLFLHCLIRSNHKTNNWRGIDVESGSFITSLESLAYETGMSVHQIRIALKHLQKTNEILIKTTNRFTQIFVVKWGDYQGVDDDGDKQTTSKWQASGKQVATNKNEKKEKNDKNNTSYKDIATSAIEYLNTQSGHNYKVTDKTEALIKARINSGATLKDIYRVIHNMTGKWEDDEKMKVYLRPETLFGTKFDTYLETDYPYRTHAETKQAIEEEKDDLRKMAYELI